jgi:hypothetical protein
MCLYGLFLEMKDRTYGEIAFSDSECLLDVPQTVILVDDGLVVDRVDRDCKN